MTLKATLSKLLDQEKGAKQTKRDDVKVLEEWKWRPVYPLPNQEPKVSWFACLLGSKATKKRFSADKRAQSVHFELFGTTISAEKWGIKPVEAQGQI
jgi:hypothetical protein